MAGYRLSFYERNVYEVSACCVVRDTVKRLHSNAQQGNQNARNMAQNAALERRASQAPLHRSNTKGWPPFNNQKWTGKTSARLSLTLSCKLTQNNCYFGVKTRYGLALCYCRLDILQSCEEARI